MIVGVNTHHTGAEAGPQPDINTLLASLGEGKSYTSSTAYDTAWTAQLVPHFPQSGFESSLTWLRSHQHPDGSWGANILHYHDRIISTLSAVIALAKIGDPADKTRIDAGTRFLWHNVDRLRYDADDTIGFPLLIAALITEGLAVDLDIPRHIAANIDVVKKKLSMITAQPADLRYTTLAYSLEAIMDYLPHGERFDFTAPGFNVGTSPSATAASLLNPNTFVQGSLDYLQQIVRQQADGGTPTVDPIDVFECAWTLNNLRAAGAVSPDDPQVRPLLDFLYRVWNPQCGLTYSSCFRVTDLDDTAEAFMVLRWGGYDVSADVFSSYEEENHFRCFYGEANPSLSANIRLLGALQMHRDHPQFEKWSNKIVRMLMTHDREGYFWFDKWHISPYYPTTYAIPILHMMGVQPLGASMLGDDKLARRVKWLLKTQQRDGGWGYYGSSTAEETAYSLQALVYWHTQVERMDLVPLHTAAAFLRKCGPLEHQPALWIGKGLYTPYKVVSSAVLMALHSYQQLSAA